MVHGSWYKHDNTHTELFNEFYVPAESNYLEKHFDVTGFQVLRVLEDELINPIADK